MRDRPWMQRHFNKGLLVGCCLIKVGIELGVRVLVPMSRVCRLQSGHLENAQRADHSQAPRPSIEEYFLRAH
jgi:hypothetical protein